jgi:hypothetical protein
MPDLDDRLTGTPSAPRTPTAGDDSEALDAY